MAGLAFDPLGNLFGSWGFRLGDIMSINLNTLRYTLLGDATPFTARGSVSDSAFIPEPTSLILLTLGIVAVMLRGKRFSRCL